MGLDWGIIYDETLAGDLVYVDVSVQSVVTTTDNTLPVTGLAAGLDPWVWDRRRLERSSERERYNTYVGGTTHGLQEQTKLEHWLSGSAQGLNDLAVFNRRQEGLLQWVPVIGTGKYLNGWEERRLFSDYSLSEPMDTLFGSVLTRSVLRDDVVASSIEVAIWRRTDEGLIVKHHDYSCVDYLTLAFDSDGEVEVIGAIPSSGAAAAFAATLEPRLHEYIVVDNIHAFSGWTANTLYVLLNQEAVLHIGNELVAVNDLDLGKAFEYKGRGNGQARDLYTQFFPVVASTCRVISLVGGVQTEWTKVDDFYSTTTQHHFVVDEDLGIISLSGYSASPLYLIDDLSSTDTVLTVFEDIAVDQYLESGVLVIGAEQIKYEGRDGTTFSDLTRGYNATPAAVHSRGDVCQLRTEGYAAVAGEELYIAYDAVPRLEYEIIDIEKRMANKATKPLNIKPTANPESNSILQIAPTTYNLDSLVLESASSSIGGDLYGPIYFGTDTSRLTITARDSAGNPVEDIEITLVLEGTGLLNSEVSPYTAISNQLGQIYSLYSAPYNLDAVLYPVLETLHTGADTTMEVSGLPEGIGVEDITVFQILKHDGSIGTLGTLTEVDSSDVIADPYGVQRLTLTIKLDELYEGGVVELLGTDLIKYRRTIIKVWDTTILDGGFDVPVSMIDLDATVNPALIVGQPAWVIRSEEIEWEASELNGARVLLYEWRDDVQHPITELPGAWFPLEPDSIDTDLLTFENRLLAIPAPTDDDSNLGGYCVICKTIVSLWGYATDPVSGRVITSNQIRLLVDLPQYLRGVDRSGALPIPYGFKFKTEEHNVGAGIGGANFITVNPSADGINQFSVYVEI